MVKQEENKWINEKSAMNYCWLREVRKGCEGNK